MLWRFRRTCWRHWTGVYIFFTDQKPGITAAKAFRNGKGELLGVIGLDIELTSLNAFLGSLQIGRSGRAMIIDETGRLVAYPEMARMMKEKGGELVALRLNELGDPVLDYLLDQGPIDAHRSKQYFYTIQHFRLDRREVPNEIHYVT
jgi:hypothetical protein